MSSGIESEPDKRANSKLGRKILLAFGVLVFTCLLAEGALRAFAPVSYRPLSKRQWGALIHQKSEIPGLAYELAPDQSITFWDVPVETNQLGMRDDLPVEGSNVDLKRIVTLGDSVTFGFGVGQSRAYPQVLEGLIDISYQLSSPREFEVLNFGVSGYGTNDEALVLEHKAMAYSPDAVVLGYHLNDPEDEAIQPLQLHFSGPEWWQYSHLCRGVAEVLHNRAMQRLGDGNYFKYIHAPSGQKWKRVLDAFDRMKEVAVDERGASLPFVVVIFPFFDGYEEWSDYPYTDLHAQVAEAAKARGFEVVDAYELFAKSGLSRAELRFDRGHPTSKGHELVASELANRLRSHFPGIPSRYTED